jgi:hypothetical protein
MTEIDPLYALPLDEFTAARDALAAELRASGDKAAAADIKKLRKPSLAAWAVNQVARGDRERMKQLFELREKIENASSTTEMRRASEERRHLIADLVRESERALLEAGHATGANTMQAITQTFHAGDSDEERDALLHGRLTRELSPSGFGGFASAFDVTQEEESAADLQLEEKLEEKLEKKRTRADELAEEADQADAEADRAAEEVAAAERALDRAKARAEAARTSAEQARKHAERARAELERAHGR